MEWHNIFCYCKYDGGLWFRVFGRGLSFKDLRKHPKLFSERYGYTKHIVIGDWLIKYVPYHIF